MLNVIVLSATFYLCFVFMMSVIMLSVVILSVVVPSMLSITIFSLLLPMEQNKLDRFSVFST